MPKTTESYLDSHREAIEAALAATLFLWIVSFAFFNPWLVPLPVWSKAILFAAFVLATAAYTRKIVRTRVSSLHTK